MFLYDNGKILHGDLLFFCQVQHSNVSFHLTYTVVGYTVFMVYLIFLSIIISVHLVFVIDVLTFDWELTESLMVVRCLSSWASWMG